MAANSDSMEVRPIVMAHHDQAKRDLARKLRREMTPAERMLWKWLRANRLANLHFRRQQIIDGFIADFFCLAARLVIEVDGGVHESQSDYDAERTRILTERGLRVLRFSNERIVHDLASVLDEIQVACATQPISPPKLGGSFPPLSPPESGGDTKPISSHNVSRGG